MDIVKTIIKFCFVLYLAIQVWVWLRFLGAFWLTDSLYITESLFISVAPFKFGLYSFLFTATPAALLYFLVHGKISAKYMLLIYAGSGAVMAVLYTVAISVFPSFVNLPWLFRHGLMMMLVAMLSGGVFYILADSVLLGNRTQAKRITGVSRARRKMLTSSAVLMGGLGFVGSITGPIRIIKNTNKFVDFDLSPLNEHDYVIVEINKRPVYIIKRTKLEIEELQKENPQLVDPHSFYSKQPANTRNNYRSIKPEYLVVSAICTHLGCSIKHVPQTGSETDTNQNEMADLPYFLLCPCHEGKFDMAGRVYKNTPPPTNLSIPDHEFISDHVVRIYYPDLKEMWFG